MKTMDAYGMRRGTRLASLLAVGCFALGAVLSASARSLLYYFDFDRVENGALVYDGVNRGTGIAAFTLKQNGGLVAPSIPDGAFGSPHAFYTSTGTSLWLGGDGARSLGCGMTRGFTISFWLKASASHSAWSDFFDFKIGSVDYRFEYRTANTTDFTVYARNSLGTDTTGATTGRLRTGCRSVPADVWTHVAIVGAPGTNSLGACSLYIGGERFGDLVLEGSGDLMRVIVGTWVIGKDSLDRVTAANNTGIDELAVFDYPATAEQVKWLAHYRPGQPADGPGREMPFAWLLDSTNATHGVLATNSGTDPHEAGHWGSEVLATASTNAALGSRYSLETCNRATWHLGDTVGLGATAGSGYTFSFWVYAPQKMNQWTDFFTYCIGGTNRSTRFEWDDQATSRIRLYGALPKNDAQPQNSRGCVIPRTVNAWNHLALVWNPEDGRADIYANGTREASVPFTSAPSDASAITEIMLGLQSREDSGKFRQNAANSGVYLDEFAMFNHSLSADQIVWLGSHVPAIPPLDATNLVRAVSVDGAWAGRLASWGVREWDGSAWTEAGRSSIWPACEDVDVEATVVFADGVTVTNDTFVTPKRLAFAVATGATLPVAVTLKSTPDSLFTPQELEIGDGIHLTVPLYAVSTLGTLTFGTNAKITFDVSNYNDGGTTNALTVGAFALPAGESDALAHFAVTDSRFTLSLSADGKTVLVAADSIPVTATWTGAGDGTSLGSAANWQCRNGAGDLLPADTLPCANTVVIASGGTAVLNAPVGTVFPWPYLRIEAASATLAADTDWRGLGAVRLQEGAVIDLNGHRLDLAAADGGGRFTDTASPGGELHFDIPAGTTVTNSTVQFAGALRLVKDGTGEFVANVSGHSYTGGTEVVSGRFSCLQAGSLRALGGIGSEICVSTNAAGDAAVFDMKGRTSLYDHTVVMRGGVFIHTGEDIAVEDQQLGNVRLEADSWFGVTNSWGMCGKNCGKIALDLAGHTLSVHIEKNKWFGIRNAEIREGVIDVAGGGGFRFAADASKGETNVATDVDLRIASPLRVGGTLSIRGYEALYA